MSIMSVRTNVAYMMAAGQLSRTNNGLANSLGKISSGLRINSAAEDAAGLGVATNLSAQSNSLDQAMRNANDGISIIQTAEGASNEVNNLLSRMRELAVQSSSETLADPERAYINDELTVDDLNVIPNGNLSLARDGRRWRLLPGRRDEQWLQICERKVRAAPEAVFLEATAR